MVSPPPSPPLSSSSSLPSSCTIPSCHLYKACPSQRIRNELMERQIYLDNDDNEQRELLLDIKTLNEIDIMRYEPTEGTNVFVQHLNDHFGNSTTTTVRILDVGSGFGGPSRLLLERRPNTTTITTVVALELIPEISYVAKQLSQRTAVADRIVHVTGDICQLNDNDNKKSCDPSALGKTSFDAVQAVLTLLHIPDIDKALQNICQQLLQSNGILYIEDFFCNTDESSSSTSGGSKPAAMSTKSITSLRDVVGCPRGMPWTQEEWVRHLRKAGFDGEILFQDVTNNWQSYVHERRVTYEQSWERHVRVQGMEIATQMLEFYTTVDTLFTNEHLRGCRILCKKKQKQKK